MSEWFTFDLAWTAPPNAIRAQSAHRVLPEAVRLLCPSANGWRRALEAGRVTRGPDRVTGATWLNSGDRLSLQWSPEAQLQPWPAGWVYGHQEADWAIVWKPAGMPTSGNGGQHLAGQLPGHPIHRLDRDTSGWVVVSQSAPMTLSLQRAFVEGHVTKSYLALATGLTPKGLDIRLPLDGKPCRTECERIASGPWPLIGEASLLRIRLHTGRTHQIRRHLHALGHGVIGDARYGNGPRYKGHGLFLSGDQLRLPHPTTGEPIEAKATPTRKFRKIQWWST